MFEIGQFIGMFFASIAIPVVILIILLLVPATKRRPMLAYGATGVLATLFPWVSIGENYGMKFAASILAAIFFFWGYSRARKKIQPA